MVVVAGLVVLMGAPRVAAGLGEHLVLRDLPVPLAHFGPVHLGEALEGVAVVALHDRRVLDAGRPGAVARGLDVVLDVVGAPHQHRLPGHLLLDGRRRRRRKVLLGGRGCLLGQVQVRVRLHLLHLGREEAVGRGSGVVGDPVQGGGVLDLPARFRAQFHYLDGLDDAGRGADGVRPRDVQAFGGIRHHVPSRSVHVRWILGCRCRLHYLLVLVDFILHGHDCGSVRGMLSCRGYRRVVGGSCWHLEEPVANVTGGGVMILGIIGPQRPVLVENIVSRRQVTIFQRGRRVQSVLEIRVSHVRGQPVVGSGRWVRCCVHVVRCTSVGCYVIHSGHGAHNCGVSGRSDLSCGRVVRQFTFRSASRQEVPQLRFVPPVHSGRCGVEIVLLKRWSAGHELVAVREVVVWKTGVEITHFEVHCSFAQEISSFFFPEIRLNFYIFNILNNIAQ